MKKYLSHFVRLTSLALSYSKSQPSFMAVFDIVVKFTIY